MIALAALLTSVAVMVLQGPSPTRRARAVLGVPRRPREIDRGVVVAGAVVVLGTLVAGWPWGTLAAGALAPLVRARVARSGEVDPGAVPSPVPVALDLVAAALAAGRPPGIAVAAAGRALGGTVGAELEVVATRLVTTADPGEVWNRTADLPGLAPLARAVLRAQRSGSAPAVVVSHVADDLRRRRQAERLRRTRAGGVATALPLGLCFLPAFFLIGIAPTLLGLLGSVFG
ncbi:type II secretion system F family protein [Aeromicrobium sp. Leaf350]|uniref:type II secretion system F family protein n=1 Tax=Aeromicrobium sp. Leaf350 TaxID=2876565 RepID=UPI001E4C5C7E|nr:type II secretion system F family protein [Aeromicrobium sp. Leaf350]